MTTLEKLTQYKERLQRWQFRTRLKLANNEPAEAEPSAEQFHLTNETERHMARQIREEVCGR